MSTLLASPAKKTPQRPVRPIGGSFEDFGEQIDREEVYYEENGQEKSIYETFFRNAPPPEIIYPETQTSVQETITETFAAQGSIEILSQISKNKEVRPTSEGTINFQVTKEVVIEEKVTGSLGGKQEVIAKESPGPVTEKLGKAAGLAGNFLETTGKITPGLFKDIFSAIIGLFKEYILPPAKKAEKKTTPQEQETEKKKVEEKRHTEQHYQTLTEDKRRVEQADQNQLLKIALGMVERPDVVAADIVDLGLNTSLDIKNIKSIYHINELRSKQIEKKDVALKQKKQQGIVSASKKSGPNLDLNKVGEGGSILSSTGGAGAG